MVTIPVESTDEVGELAKGFNEMVEKLRERETLEKRLYEAEHLSRVGQLASGIAHEIRNPLNYISLAIDHLRSGGGTCLIGRPVDSGGQNSRKIGVPPVIISTPNRSP